MALIICTEARRSGSKCDSSTSTKENENWISVRIGEKLSGLSCLPSAEPIGEALCRYDVLSGKLLKGSVLLAGREVAEGEWPMLITSGEDSVNTVELPPN